MLLAGLVLLALWRRRETVPQPLRGGPAEARVRKYGVAEQELRQALERRDRLRRQVADLKKAEVDLGGKIHKAPAAAASDPADKEEDSAPWGKAFLKFGKFFVSERVRELKPRLKLTENQEERLRDLFLKEMDDVLGSGDWESLDEKAMELKVRAGVAGILDSRQMTEYDKFEAEEKERQAVEQRQSMVESLSATLDLKPQQAKSLDQILKADPGLVKGGNMLESVSPGELEGSAERLEESQRRLAAALEPELTGEQVARLESHFKDALERQRELVRYYKLFVAESRK
jgi:hypothetical protein